MSENFATQKQNSPEQYISWVAMATVVDLLF